MYIFGIFTYFSNFCNIARDGDCHSQKSPNMKNSCNSRLWFETILSGDAFHKIKICFDGIILNQKLIFQSVLLIFFRICTEKNKKQQT